MSENSPTTTNTKEAEAQTVRDAYEECIKRYPDSEPALVWFITASGILKGDITDEHIAWAESVMKQHNL